MVLGLREGSIDWTQVNRKSCNVGKDRKMEECNSEYFGMFFSPFATFLNIICAVLYSFLKSILLSVLKLQLLVTREVWKMGLRIKKKHTTYIGKDVQYRSWDFKLKCRKHCMMRCLDNLPRGMLTVNSYGTWLTVAF